jgi:hypothetical protein
MRLGGGPSILDPFPRKPPGMHRLTYYRLFGKAATAQEHWIALQSAHLRRRYDSGFHLHDAAANAEDGRNIPPGIRRRWRPS